MKLRPYQTAALDGLRAAIATGKRRMVLVCPTGGGKTLCASEMIRSSVQRGRRSIVVAHRKELIDQTVDKLKRFGVEAGVIMGSDRRRDDYLPVQVCTIQTLAAWARKGKPLPPADLLIADECHHSLSESFRMVLEKYPSAVVVGLTATPWRADKIGLADFYEGHVLAATCAHLMEIGALVQYDAFGYDAPDLHEVGMVAGEFNQKQLDVACNTQVLVGSVVKEYVAHARGKRAIVFPVSIAHSKALVEEFKSAGVPAAHVDCHMKKAEREAVLAALASGSVQVCASVGILTEGFDLPAAEVCILARPTKSLSLHIQMIGRVLRPSPETGKTKALIHDHAGNLMRHGFPEDERSYELTATPARVRDLHTCPLCCAVFGALKDGKCPKCGELIAPPAEKSTATGPRQEKQLVSGTRISKEQIEKLRAERAAKGIDRELTDAQLAKVAKATRQEQASEFLRLCAVADQKGFKKGFAAHQFRAVFGKWPKFTDEELAEAVPTRTPFVPLPPKRERVEASAVDPFAADEMEIVPGVDPFGGGA